LAQYADYFETEGEENIKYLREAASDNISDLLAAYRDYSKLGNETRVVFRLILRDNTQSPSVNGTSLLASLQTFWKTSRITMRLFFQSSKSFPT